MQYYRYHFLAILVVLFCASGLLFIAVRFAYAQPEAIACPRNQTITLSGANAPPGQGLIVFFNGQPVGGGFSDQAGNWRIPLRVNEPAGRYLVEVRVRASQQLVVTKVCYVDVPLTATPAATPTNDNAPTAIPTLPPTAAPPTPIPRPTLTPTATVTGAAQATATPTATVTGAAQATATPARATATSTAQPAATPTITATALPGRTPTLVPAGIAVTLEIFPYDPNDDSLNNEYVILRSEEENDLSIGGWRIVNISRPEQPTFVFPPYTLAPEVDIYLYTGSGTNNLARGDFYWGRSTFVWRRGDTAHLLDAQGRLVSAYQVP